jgi:ABC-type antimicrobial peptide transport system permease subunit
MGVIRQGALMATAGVIVGAAGGYALATLATGYFNGMRMPEPLPVAGSAAVLIGAALIASLIPAMRAARVDVMEALRAD